MALSRTQVWILAARPRTLPAAAAPVLMGSAIALQQDLFHLWAALAAVFGAMFIQIGTNLANDYFDYVKGSDRADRTGPMRVTQAGLVSASSMKRAVWLVFGLAALAGVYLVFRGGWPILVVGLLSILFGIMYTGGPFPLGYNGLGELFVLIFFGPVAIGGTYFVQALDINWIVLVAGLSPGLFSVAILAVNNLRDIEADRLSGKKTLAVLFGKEFARTEYTIAILIASLIPIGLALRVADLSAVSVAALVLPLSFPSIWTVLRGADSEALNRVLATTGMILLLFSILFSIGLML